MVPQNEMVTTVWYPHGSKKGGSPSPCDSLWLGWFGGTPWCHDLGTPQIGTDRFRGAVARPGKAVASSTASISMSPKVVTWVSTRCWVSFRSCLVEGWNLAGMKTWKFGVWRHMNFLGCYFVQLWWESFSNSGGKLRTMIEPCWSSILQPDFVFRWDPATIQYHCSWFSNHMFHHFSEYTVFRV